MYINKELIERYFLGEDKNVRIIKNGLSLLGKILEADDNCIVFKTITKTSVISLSNIDEILLIRHGGC